MLWKKGAVLVRLLIEYINVERKDELELKMLDKHHKELFSPGFLKSDKIG